MPGRVVLMRRVMVLLIAGTVMSGLAAAYASSGKVRQKGSAPVQQASVTVAEG